ncbi:MAG: hypothetical protein LCH96_14735 [Actinobacteria bacterium]|nr:hypothetical protein [Actinomycetota bacterium]
MARSRPHEGSAAAGRAEFTRETSLYRYYDQLGLLLYVGITDRSIRRNDEHNTKEWWKFVVRQEVEHFATRDLALGAEKDWIIKKRPPFNVQHNLGHAELRSAYLEFRAQGGNAAELIPRVLPKRLPLTATLRIESRLVLESEEARFDLLDLAEVAPCIVASGGRRARILGVDVVGGRLRILVHTRDAKDCRGAHLVIRFPSCLAERVTMKQLELEFSRPRRWRGPVQP